MGLVFRLRMFYVDFTIATEWHEVHGTIDAKSSGTHIFQDKDRSEDVEAEPKPG